MKQKFKLIILLKITFSLHFFQVRPINLLNSDTKSEMLHYWDSYLRSEDEWFSVYSTGYDIIINHCIKIVKLNTSLCVISA